MSKLVCSHFTLVNFFFLCLVFNPSCSCLVCDEMSVFLTLSVAIHAGVLAVGASVADIGEENVADSRWRPEDKVFADMLDSSFRSVFTNVYGPFHGGDVPAIELTTCTGAGLGKKRNDIESSPKAVERPDSGSDFKRLRPSSESSVESVPVAAAKSEAVSRPSGGPRLNRSDARVCLEEMIAAPEALFTDFFKRVSARLPGANKELFRGYHKEMVASSRIPLWFHNLLVDRVGASHDARVEAVNAYIRDTGVVSWRRSVGREISKWMEFCIQPLLAKPDRADEACRAYTTRKGDPGMMLVGEQLRLFFEAELRTLSALERCMGGDSQAPVMIAITTTVVPHTSDASRGARVSASAGVLTSGIGSSPSGEARGLTLAEKRVCLEVLIKNPFIGRSAFVERLSSLLPHVSEPKLMHMHQNTMATVRVPKPIHSFLLAQRAGIYSHSIVEKAALELAGKLPRMRCRLRCAVKMWIEHCIGPQLRHPEVDPWTFCSQSADPREKGTVHLAAPGRVAVFTKLLTELDNEIGAQDNADEQ